MALFVLALSRIVIALIILGILSAIGLVLLIVGIVCKKNNKDKNRGRKFPVVLIVTGALLMSIPDLIGIVMIISAVY